MKRKIIISVIISVLLISSVVYADEQGMFQGFKIVNVTVDGKAVQGDTPAILFNGRTMVPLKFVSDAMGATTNWDGSTNTAQIISKQSQDTKQRSVQEAIDELNAVYGLSLKTEADLNSVSNADLVSQYLTQGHNIIDAYALANPDANTTFKNSNGISQIKVYASIANEYKRLDLIGQILDTLNFQNGILFEKMNGRYLNNSLESLNKSQNDTLNTAINQYNQALKDVSFDKLYGLDVSDMDTILSKYNDSINNYKNAMDVLQQFTSNPSLELSNQFNEYNNNADAIAVETATLAANGYNKYYNLIQNY